MERCLHYYYVNAYNVKYLIKTGFTSWVLLFQEILEFQNEISICYEQQKNYIHHQKCQLVKLGLLLNVPFVILLLPMVKQSVLS
jgi:hypothetical protein